ncbi:Uncharacterised protein [Chlamydia trachomatis]|nr:Uncharacterised protein [Chlamydia trachomatis]
MVLIVFYYLQKVVEVEVEVEVVEVCYSKIERMKEEEEVVEVVAYRHHCCSP